MTIADYRSPEDLPLLKKTLDAGALSKNLGLWTHIKKDGTRIEVEVSTTSIEFEGRRAQASLLRDVTDYNRMMRDLEDSERNYRELFDSAADALIIAEAHTGRIRAMNDAALRMYGCEREEIKELTMLSLTAEPEKTSALIDAMRTHQHQSVPQRMHRRKDGSLFPVEIRVSSHLSKSGKMLVFAARDITERVQGQQELAESERRFRLITESISQVFWMSNPEKTRMQYVSPAYESVWGRTRESLYREPQIWLDSIHPDDRERVLAFARDWKEGRYDVTYRIRRPDGEVRWIRNQAFLVRDEGGVLTNITGVAEDVTEGVEAERKLRETEAQLLHAQKMEAVGRLAGGVAHDFNNLLTAILGLTEISIESASHGTQLRSDLEEIERTAKRAAALTQQLLAFSRRQAIAPRPIDLNDVILGMAKLLRSVIGEDVELAVMPGPVPAAARADPGQIEQLVMNLAVNARDAMPHGGKLTIETGVVSLDAAAAAGYGELAPGQYASITVTDTGTGISDEVRPHLFEPFFTTKEQGKGTGLGLATCYGVAKQNGGLIFCRSVLGQGSTFQLLLPRLDVGLLKPEKDQREEAAPGGRETVLLVEDETSVRRLGSRILSEKGYRILEAGDGEEALKVLDADAERTIRLALVDMVMPKLGGLKLAQIIGERRPDVRILFTSGYTEDALPGRGAYEFDSELLRKPFSPRELCARIRAALDAPRV
jgi:PAS domain S-box-containing protein